MTIKEITLENAQHVVRDFLTETHEHAVNDKRAERPNDAGDYSASRTLACDIADLIGVLLAQKDSLFNKPNARIVEAFEDIDDSTNGIERQNALNVFLTELALGDLVGFSEDLFDKLGERFEETFDIAPEFPGEEARAHELGIRFLVQYRNVDRISAETELHRINLVFQKKYKKVPSAEEIITYVTQNK